MRTGRLSLGFASIVRLDALSEDSLDGEDGEEVGAMPLSEHSLVGAADAVGGAHALAEHGADGEGDGDVESFDRIPPLLSSRAYVHHARGELRRAQLAPRGEEVGRTREDRAHLWGHGGAESERRTGRPCVPRCMPGVGAPS